MRLKCLSFSFVIHLIRLQCVSFSFAQPHAHLGVASPQAPACSKNPMMTFRVCHIHMMVTPVTVQQDPCLRPVVLGSNRLDQRSHDGSTSAEAKRKETVGRLVHSRRFSCQAEELAQIQDIAATLGCGCEPLSAAAMAHPEAGGEDFCHCECSGEGAPQP